MTKLPRAGETWERVRDGKRVEVERSMTLYGQPRVVTWHRNGIGRTSHRAADFLREFRRVEPSDGRET
jgi:hypothetical protein